MQQKLRSAPPHTGAPEPQKCPERVPRGRAPKVPKECAPESQKSPKRVQKSDFRLFSVSFETSGRTLWALSGPCPGVLFPDSFQTLLGFRAPQGPGAPVWGGGRSQSKMSLFHLKKTCTPVKGTPVKRHLGYSSLGEMGIDGQYLGCCCRKIQLRDGPNTTTTIIFLKSFASDVASKRHLMAHDAHQMQNLSVFSVFHCVEGAFGAASRSTPEMKNGVPRDELENHIWVVPSQQKLTIPEKHECTTRKDASQKFIEFFRGRLRGGDNFTSRFQVLQTLARFKASKAPFLTLRVATPSGAPRQAPLEKWNTTSARTTSVGAPMRVQSCDLDALDRQRLIFL